MSAWVMPSVDVYENFLKRSQAVASGRRRWAPPKQCVGHKGGGGGHRLTMKSTKLSLPETLSISLGVSSMSLSTSELASVLQGELEDWSGHER